jgi:hypothetical protein
MPAYTEREREGGRPGRLHQRLKLETISRDIQIIMPLGYNGRSFRVHEGNEREDFVAGG